MQFKIEEQQCSDAKTPHEIFLINLIAVHILWFVASLGIVNTFWQPLAATPVVSASVLFYLLWRAKKSQQCDEWFVSCHWQIVAKRSLIFICMIGLLLTVSLLGWLGYTYLGMMKVAVFAIIGGIGILPMMATVLGLIIMESDALHQAKQGKLGKAIYERFPNPDAIVISDS